MAGTPEDAAKAPAGRIVVKKIRMTKRKKRSAKSRPVVGKKSKATASIVRNSAPIPCDTENKPTSTASIGLPAFRFSAKPFDSNTGDENPVLKEDPDEFFCSDDDDLPSDTLMAIQSLIQSDRGLHVPITNNGSVQVILESQIYSTFHENHASNVNAELLKLIETNKIKRMCCHDMSTMAFMLTEDYAKAVWDSHNHNNHHQCSSTINQGGGEKIVTWFLAELNHWTNHSISESSLEDQWERSHPQTNLDCTNIEPRNVVLYLLNAQFLIRDQHKNNGSNQEDTYSLWLPNWGIVLKTWNEARKQLLTLLAQRKEMSKANVLQKNRHSRISTAFLIHDLLSNEKIRVVERPFGEFIQLIKEEP